MDPILLRISKLAFEIYLTFNLNLFTGRYPWSDRGNRGPQPEGNGDCLAILNNVYNDRVKYHDVACHHTKPTICECP